MIVAAAIRSAVNGAVYALPAPARHHDVIHFMAAKAGLPKPIKGDQGFIDSERGFVDRETAADIALAIGQIDKLNVPPKLYSEDLW